MKNVVEGSEVDGLMKMAQLSDMFFNWSGHELYPDTDMLRRAEMFLEETSHCVDHDGRDAEFYVLDYNRRL